MLRLVAWGPYYQNPSSKELCVYSKREWGGTSILHWALQVSGFCNGGLTCAPLFPCPGSPPLLIELGSECMDGGSFSCDAQVHLSPSLP